VVVDKVRHISKNNKIVVVPFRLPQRMQNLNRRMADNTMAKRNRTERQATIYKALYRKLKIEQYIPQYKHAWNSDAPGGLALSAPQTYFQFVMMHNSVKSRIIKALDMRIFNTQLCLEPKLLIEFA